MTRMENQQCTFLKLNLYKKKEKKSELLPKNTKQIMSIVHRANFIIMVLKD